MQQTANKMAVKIDKTCSGDLANQRQFLKEVNTLLGEKPNVINIQADCVYNNTLYPGIGKTPFRPAAQLAYIIAENITYKHQTVLAVTMNKLCSNTGKHKLSTKAGPHPGNCSSNLNIEEDIEMKKGGPNKFK